MSRINFIRTRFNVISETEESFDPSLEKFSSDGKDSYYFIDSENKIKIREVIFDKLFKADPTNKKIYLQWLFTMLVKYIKKDVEEAIRFVEEDLDSIYDNLKLFESVKKSNIFKIASKHNYSIRHISDPTDINRYTNQTELYDAVYPFYEKDNDGLLKYLRIFVSMREATIPFEDKNYLVYIPTSLKANEALSSYASWCTCRKDNGMYKTYQNNRRPDGTKSKLYVIIDKSNFNMYQLHFESKQIRNRSNSQDISGLINNFLVNSVGLDNYIYEELIALALSKTKGKPTKNLNYLEHALLLGYGRVYIDAAKTETDRFIMNGNSFRNGFSLKKFTKLNKLILSNCKLSEIPDDVFTKKTLNILSLPGNKINYIPEEISNLKKLFVLNLNDNNLKTLPETIKYLDPSLGGSLMSLTIKNNKISDTELNKIKKLLPNVNVL